MTDNQPPAAQPVARIDGRNYHGGPVLVWLDHPPPIGTHLYATPDPRIAELEGLLREAHETLSSGLESDSELEHEWSKSDRELCERIEAALKEG